MPGASGSLTAPPRQAGICTPSTTAVGRRLPRRQGRWHESGKECAVSCRAPVGIALASVYAARTARMRESRGIVIHFTPNRRIPPAKRGFVKSSGLIRGRPWGADIMADCPRHAATPLPARGFPCKKSTFLPRSKAAQAHWENTRAYVEHAKTRKAPKTKVLRLFDAALPSGQAAWGTCATTPSTT